MKKNIQPSWLNNSINVFDFIDLMKHEAEAPSKYPETYSPYLIICKEIYETLKNELVIDKKLFNTIQKMHDTTIYLLGEPWCPDVAVLLPVIEAIESIDTPLKFNFYLRDQNSDLMDQFLTNGGKSIPILFHLDELGNTTQWGPRCQGALDVMNTPEEDIQKKRKALLDWYYQDKTQSIQTEWNEWFKTMK